MLSSESVAKIKSLADEVSRREGCQLYDVEFASNPKNRILRIFIDAENDHVSVEQCANVSRGLSLLLDVQDVIPGGAYELEVSSPGVERPLREPWHYKKAMGKEVKAVMVEPVAGLKGEVRSLTGELLSCDDEKVTLKYHDGEVSIPYSNIKRAHTVFTIKKNEKKR